MSRETERSKTVYGIYIRKKNDGFKTFRAALPHPFRSMQEIHPSMILYLDHSRALAPISKDLLFVFHPIPQTPHTRHARSNNQHTCYVHKENRRRLHAQRFCTSSTTRAFQGSCEQPSTLHSLHARAETSSLVCGIARAELSGADEREAIEHIASRSSDPELTSMGLEFGGVEGRAPRVPGLVRMLMLELTESLEHLGGEVVLDRRF